MTQHHAGLVVHTYNVALIVEGEVGGGGSLEKGVSFSNFQHLEKREKFPIKKHSGLKTE